MFTNVVILCWHFLAYFVHDMIPLSLCMQTNQQCVLYIYILRASIFTHISCTYYTHVIFISYAYHSRTIYLRYWWHLGSNHATCWPFSTRNRRATINKCKNTNLTVTPARAPQHMLTYVYLCPYLGFWPTSNHPRNCESQSNPPARFLFHYAGFAPPFMRIPPHRNVPIWVLDFNPPG